MMKRKIILFLLALVGFETSDLFAQSGQATKSVQEMLMSHKWYPDIYDEDDEETSFRIYTKNQCIDSVFTEDGEIEVYIDEYYLSDAPDNIFDKNKIGKNTDGKYIILPGSEAFGIGSFILKLVEISDKKLVIQHLTPGMSAYGNINVCYPTPPKKESVD